MKDSARRRLVLPIALAVVAAVIAVVGVSAIAAYVSKERLAKEKETIVVRVSSARSPEENETLVAEPLEQALAGLKGLERMRSESRFGHVQTSLTFSRLEIFEAHQLVAGAVSRVTKTLPSDVLAPTISHVDLDPAVVFALGDASAKEAFERTIGVGQVEVCGAPSERMHVVLDPSKMAAHGVEVTQVVVALTMNTEFPALVNGGRTSLEELETVRLGKNDPVQLRDLAVFERRPNDRDCALVRGSELKHEKQVLLRIVRQHGADAKEVQPRLATTAKEVGARMIDPGTTLLVAYHAPHTRAEALDQAGWLVEQTGSGTIGVLVRDRSIEVLRTIDPGDTRGTRAALPMSKVERPKGPTPRYAGILAAPKERPERLVVTLRGPGLDVLANRADRLKPVVSAVKGVGPFLGPPPGARTPHFEASIDREAAARAGVKGESIATTLRVATGGMEMVGVVLHAGRPERDDDLSVYRTLLVNKVPLDRVLRLEQRLGPETIVRVDRERAIELRWEVTSDVSDDVKKAIGDPNVRVEIVP